MAEKNNTNIGFSMFAALFFEAIEWTLFLMKGDETMENRVMGFVNMSILYTISVNLARGTLLAGAFQLKI